MYVCVCVHICIHTMEFYWAINTFRNIAELESPHLVESNRYRKTSVAYFLLHSECI